jgi:hypothetical protein
MAYGNSPTAGYSLAGVGPTLPQVAARHLDRAGGCHCPAVGKRATGAGAGCTRTGGACWGGGDHRRRHGSQGADVVRARDSLDGQRADLGDGSHGSSQSQRSDEEWLWFVPPPSWDIPTPFRVPAACDYDMRQSLRSRHNVCGSSRRGGLGTAKQCLRLVCFAVRKLGVASPLLSLRKLFKAAAPEFKAAWETASGRPSLSAAAE